MLCCSIVNITSKPTKFGSLVRKVLSDSRSLSVLGFVSCPKIQRSEESPNRRRDGRKVSSQKCEEAAVLSQDIPTNQVSGEGYPLLPLFLPFFFPLQICLLFNSVCCGIFENSLTLVLSHETTLFMMTFTSQRASLNPCLLMKTFLAWASIIACTASNYPFEFLFLLLIFPFLFTVDIFILFIFSSFICI